MLVAAVRGFELRSNEWVNDGVTFYRQVITARNAGMDGLALFKREAASTAF
jgi:hypothetical protein